MSKQSPVPLAKREKQVMDVLYRLGRGTVSEVRHLLAEAPSYSAVRSTLRILEEKGHVRHEHDANRYVYLPTRDPEKAQMTALNEVLNTFFEGSAEKVVLTLMESKASELTPDALERISAQIEKARQEGR